MTWKNERHFDDYRKGLKVTVGVDPDGDLGILWQDSLRKGQEYSIIIAGHEALALAEHINEMYGYSGPGVDATIATLTAERDALVEAVKAMEDQSTTVDEDGEDRCTQCGWYAYTHEPACVFALAAKIKGQDDD